MALESIVAAFVGATITFSPLLLWGWLRHSRPLMHAAMLASGLFLLEILCVYLPALSGATGMTWAWLGKGVELFVFGTMAWLVLRRDSGISLPHGWIWLPVSVLVGIGVSIPVLLTGTGAPSAVPTWDRLLYQATMPGLAEELVYRGVMLAVLDQRLGRPLQYAKVRWGLGALLTTVIFYLGHAISFEPGWQLSLDTSPAFDFLLFGVAMCWMRYRFDSVWPCILAHNFHNCVAVALVPLLRGQ